MKHFLHFSLRITLSALFLVFIFSSCTSKEERVIEELKSLSELIAEQGDTFDEEDWDFYYNKYEEIISEAETSKMTDKQLRELGKLKAKFAKVFSKQIGKNFGKTIKNLLEEGKGFLEGLSNELIDEN